MWRAHMTRQSQVSIRRNASDVLRHRLNFALLGLAGMAWRSTSVNGAGSQADYLFDGKTVEHCVGQVSSPVLPNLFTTFACIVLYC